MPHSVDGVVCQLEIGMQYRIWTQDNQPMSSAQHRQDRACLGWFQIQP